MNKKNFKKSKNWLALKGEGTNSHFVEGNILVFEKPEFSELFVNSDGILHHKTPTGKFAEHNPLSMKKGLFIQGKQVEYNPWTNNIEQIWD